MIKVTIKGDGGKVIHIDEEFVNCFKCGKKIRNADFAFYCEANKLVFCSSVECKRVTCDKSFFVREHLDFFGLVSNKVEKIDSVEDEDLDMLEDFTT